MLSSKALILAPILLLAVSSVSGCAPAALSLPPAADLAVEPKPVPGEDTVTSGIAAALYNVSVEEWGERGWAAVARNCRWSKAMGLKIECPPAP